jgi:hypothetical protein
VAATPKATIIIGTIRSERVLGEGLKDESLRVRRFGEADGGALGDGSRGGVGLASVDPPDTRIAMIWPSDSRCRMIGEDVWEYETSERQFLKLAPAEVITAKRAGELLEPLIKPLPSFDDSLLIAA